MNKIRICSESEERGREEKDASFFVFMLYENKSLTIDAWHSSKLNKFFKIIIILFILF